MTFLIMMAVLFIILRNLDGGRHNCFGVRRWQSRRLNPWWMEHRDRLGAPPEVTRVAAPRETPLESLQRRFASGAIGVEEYEREVGKLFGLK